MKITKVEYIPVRIPKKGPKGGVWRTALGATPFGDAAIVLLHTDCGEVGLGEVSSIWDTNASGLVAGYGSRIAEAVIGLEPFAITEAQERMSRAVIWNKNANCLRAGIEMAMYDLMGKHLALPVYQLLGGKRREKIELSHSVAMGSVEERVEQVAKFVGQGFGTVKVKVGAQYEEDLEAVRAIRERFGPSLKIRVDANMSWRDAKTLLRVIDSLLSLGVLSIEQPFAPQELAQLASLRAHSPLPILLDESVWEPADALRAIRADAGDLLNTYVSESGGLYPAMQIANLCDIAGIGFCIGSMPEFGIGTVAALHLGIAAPRIDHPSDVIGNLYFADDIIAEVLPVKDGFAYAVDRPGLGVSLDWEKVRRYRIDSPAG